MKHLVRPEEQFAIDLEITQEVSLFPEAEKSRGKLFYLSRNWLGDKDTESSRRLLAGIIESLTNIGDSKQAFLLVEDAVESLDSTHSCALAWHKIVQLGLKVYVAAASLESRHIEIPAGLSGRAAAGGAGVGVGVGGSGGIIPVNEGEIADLLITYEVVTLC